MTSAPWVPKGRSHEVTLEHDVVARHDIEAVLRRIATDVVGDAETVAANAVALLDRLELGHPIRLLGVHVKLTDP